MSDDDEQKGAAWGNLPPIVQPPPRRYFDLREAAWRFTADAQLGRKYVDLFWRSRVRSPASECLTADELEHLISLEGLLASELLAKLLAGKLSAHWFPPDSTMPQQIEPGWWNGASLDLTNGTAARGKTFCTEVMVHSPTLVPFDLQGQANAWMKANVIEYVPKQRDKRMNECCVAVNCTTTIARKAWGTLPESIKGKSRTSQD